MHGFRPHPWCSSWRAAAYGKPIYDPFGKDGIWWEGPHAGAVEGSNDEGPAETRCWRLTTAPIPCSHAQFSGKECTDGGNVFLVRISFSLL